MLRPDDFETTGEFEIALRDWFAGQAIPELINAVCNGGFSSKVLAPQDLLASKAYEIADAMLAARRTSEQANEAEGRPGLNEFGF